MKILKAGTEQLGIALDAEQLGRFEDFASLLLKWNRKFNLTRIVDPDEIEVKHFLDSLSLLSVVNLGQGCSVIDIGTGAGLPGIALKIARPDIRVTLLDSVRKKIVFLDAAVKELSLTDVKTVHARAEDAGRDGDFRERFDFAVSRAVARLGILAELCLPFCRLGGIFVAYKGPDANEEVKAASGAVRVLGGVSTSVHELILPSSDIKRSIVVVTKKKPSPIAYPRKAGILEKNPLI